MGTNISITELKIVLDTTPADQNIMLAGKHGIGKSQIITSYYSSKGMKVQTLFLGQMSDSGDIIGLPRIKDDQTVFAMPQWFPKDNTPIVLFLDELNRARPEALQCVMDLTLNKKLAGRVLPEGSRIIAAVNAGEEYQLTELDPALVDRFNVYNLQPTPSEWLMYAKNNMLDERVIEFITNNPEMLLGLPKEKASDLDKTPSPRAWERVSDILTRVDEINNVCKKIIAGVVGPEAASSFSTFMRTKTNITGEDVLLHYDEAMKNKVNRMNLHERAILNESVIRAISIIDYRQYNQKMVEDNVTKYVVDLFSKGNSKEAQASFMEFMKRRDLYIDGIRRLLKIDRVFKVTKDFIDRI